MSLGDRSTGTTVLEDLYAKWSRAPVEVDLQTLWNQLGVRVVEGQVRFDDQAPLAAVRTAITQPALP